MRTDLHIHSVASDGVYTVSQICSKAISAGLAGIAITDHDTVDGLAEIKELKKKYNDLKIVPGVEIGTYWNELDIHMLGYNINYNLNWFRDYLISLQNTRLKRMEKMISKIKNLGYEISNTEIMESAGGSSLGRPHIARVLVKKGYFPDVQQVFKSLLNRGQPAYVPRKKISPFEAIEVITAAGGIPVLAHPGLSLTEDFGLINELAKRGLLGIEVYYPLHTSETVYELLKIAASKDLLVTGGSDFHGYEDDELGKSYVNISAIHEIYRLSKKI